MPVSAFAPVHPGEILSKEFLEPHGLTPYSVSPLLHVPRARIERIVCAEKPVTLDMARRLARLFGTTDMFWLNLQLRYDQLTEPQADDLADIQPLAAP